MLKRVLKIGLHDMIKKYEKTTARPLFFHRQQKRGKCYNSLMPQEKTGFNTVLLLIFIAVLLGGGFFFWKTVWVKNENTINPAPFQAKPSVTITPAPPTAIKTPTPAPTYNPKQLIWQQTEDGWISIMKPPVCPSMIAPVSFVQVTSILYPGQTRGGNYKPHGGFRFDGAANNLITVTAPLDGFIVRGAQYLAEDELQYTFDVMNNCGLMYRLGHLRSLPANLKHIADTWPDPVKEDSRTHPVDPPVAVKQGEILAEEVGLRATKNVFFDWGVYDFRQPNSASESPSYQAAHMDDKELSWHAVCWFDLLSPLDKAAIRALPPGDPKSGKTSDYCK